jgi:hypothetical protein
MSTSDVLAIKKMSSYTINTYQKIYYVLLGHLKFDTACLKVTYNEMTPYKKDVHPLFWDVAICHWMIGA